MTRTVEDYLIDIMLEAGVRHVYGIVGHSANPVADAIRRTDGKLSFIHVRTKRRAPAPRVPMPRSPAVAINKFLTVTVIFVDVGLVLIAVGAFGSIDTATKLGAASFVISALLALYIATAQMWNLTYKRTVLPLYPWT
ncbi:MAG: thiamine pyrophosphate-binding protein [Candidatus Limnocylindrales bacterium]